MADDFCTDPDQGRSSVVLRGMSQKVEWTRSRLVSGTAAPDAIRTYRHRRGKDRCPPNCDLKARDQLCPLNVETRHREPSVASSAIRPKCDVHNAIRNDRFTCAP